MIFKDELCAKVLNGEKTQTRRLKKDNEYFSKGLFDLPDRVMRRSESSRRDTIKWEVGRTYAVQPGRGKNAIGRFKLLAIREERLQDITLDDVIEEGIDLIHLPFAPFATIFGTTGRFVHLWDLINKKLGTRWDDNPPVWVLEFQRIELEQ